MSITPVETSPILPQRSRERKNEVSDACVLCSCTCGLIMGIVSKALAALCYLAIKNADDGTDEFLGIVGTAMFGGFAVALDALAVGSFCLHLKNGGRNG